MCDHNTHNTAADRSPDIKALLEDDVIFMRLQGSTQYDALGHVWHDNKLWNGYDAMSTIGGMDKGSDTSKSNCAQKPWKCCG
jgi:hypothetical protein